MLTYRIFDSTKQCGGAQRRRPAAGRSRDVDAIDFMHDALFVRVTQAEGFVDGSEFWCAQVVIAGEVTVEVRPADLIRQLLRQPVGRLSPSPKSIFDRNSMIRPFRHACHSSV